MELDESPNDLNIGVKFEPNETREPSGRVGNGPEEIREISSNGLTPERIEKFNHFTADESLVR